MVVVPMVLLLVNGLLIGIVFSVPVTEHNSRTFRNALNQQGMQTILQSIEERLRNLDQVYASRYSTRTDLNTDHVTRRLEILETKLNRIESLIEAQLTKISENMSSKNFKDDITKDQIFRKIDTVYERVNHKLGYIEGKLEMDILKLENKIETTITKIERMDHSISVRHADIEAEITDSVEMIETVKNNIENIRSDVTNSTQQQMELSEKHIEKHITNLVTQFEQQVNNTSNNNSVDMCNKNEFPNDFSYEEKFKDYENKITNICNELWTKSENIENLVKNLTRNDFDENRKIRHVSFYNQNDAILESLTESIKNTLQRKFSELGKKLDTNFQNVMLTQNLFLESCYRIQLEESQLENKISLVLEKLLDSFTNKSAITFKEIQNLEEMIKSHDAHVYRNLNQNTNTMLKLTDKSTDDRKQFQQNITNILCEIRQQYNDMSDQNSKINEIMDKIQELQEQINGLGNKIHENIQPQNKMLENILMQKKSIWYENVQRQNNDNTTQQLFNDAENLTPRNSTTAIQNQQQSIDDISLEIMPERNDTKTDIRVIDLKRFNYTIIRNENGNDTDSQNELQSMNTKEKSSEKETMNETEGENIENATNGNGLLKDDNLENSTPETQTTEDMDNTTVSTTVIPNENEENSSEIILTENQDYDDDYEIN